MQNFISQLPFGVVTEDGKTYPLPNGESTYHNDVIYLWVSITESLAEEHSPTADTPRFPVIFDTGFNNDAIIDRKNLVLWVGADVCDKILRRSVNKSLKIEDKKTKQFEIIQKYYAGVWIWPNVPGSREPDVKRKAIPIDLPEEIAVIDIGSPIYKSQMLLGMKVVRDAKWRITIISNDKHDAVSIAAEF